MREVINGQEVGPMFWMGPLFVSEDVQNYWGNRWMDEARGPNWRKKIRYPARAALRRFDSVWYEGDFAEKIRNAPLTATDNAAKLCPVRFQLRHFKRGFLHKVVEVEGRRYLVQIDSLWDGAIVERMWVLS